MMPFRSFFIIAVCLVLLARVTPVHAQAEFKFRSLETETMRVIYYDMSHAYVLPHIARCFENSMSYYYNFLGYTPTEQVTILLQDFDDYGYAGTSTIPNNYVTLGIEPFEYVYETCPTNERFNWVISHELLHVVASEKSAGIDRFWRSVFLGKVAADSRNPESMIYSYLCSPRRYAPRWYHEGLAVYMETWMAGGIGRALGGYDEMVFRAMVRDDAYFYDVVGLESEGTTSDFQIGQNSYLYGTRFMSYLALEYGPEKVIEWMNRDDGSKAYYASAFRKTFDASLDDVWQQWIAWERAWENANLDRVRQYPITPQRNLCDKILGSASRAYYDPAHNAVYTAVNYPGEFAHIAAIDVETGSIERLCDVQTPALYYVTSLAYDPKSQTLFYTTNNGKHWRDLNALDIATGKSRRLLRDCRTGDLAFNRADSTLWGVQHHNGISRLVKFNPPYDSWDDLYTTYELPFGRDLFDIDISPDGKWLTGSMIEVTGRVRLVRFDVDALNAYDAGYDVLYEFTNTAPANFVFSDDGRYIYGTAYETGVSNVFRFDVDAEQMECLSNCETGYFRPTYVSTDSLVVFEYRGNGLRPVMIPIVPIEDVNAISYLGNEVVSKHPVVRDWKLGSPRTVNLDSVTTYAGDYRTFRSITTASLYPVTEAYKVYGGVGLRWNFMDPLGMHGGNITATVTPASAVPDNEKAHVAMNLRHWPWTFSATYNKADFYDYFGPKKSSRKGYSGRLSYGNYIISDKPRFLQYEISAAYYGGLEQLPYNQNVAATFDRYTTASAELSFSRVNRSIGAVDEERGVKWRLGYHANYVNGDFYGAGVAELDLGFLTPLDHSSIWLRPSAGYSRGNRGDSFANFYFGAFGNNYVDHQKIKRYRGYESLPGVDFDNVSGTNFAKLMAEWTLPPWRFQRIGHPLLYVTWARAALFSSGLVTNITHGDFQREVYNLGGQVDLRLVIFSGLTSTLSFGYAGSFEEGRDTETEFMISLKIM